MSSTSSNYHIPFPRAFLAVNTPAKQSASPADVLTSTQPEQPAHGFLSNRPARVQSTSSVSSDSSTGSVSDVANISAPSSPATKTVDSPVLGPKIFTPLAVNTKHALPPTNVEKITADNSGFLSNRH